MNGAGARPHNATLAAAVFLTAMAGGRPEAGQTPAAVDSDVPPAATRLAWEHPAGPPPPRISLPGFADTGFATFGWIDAGIGGNNWGSPFNGPITFPDRSWQGQVNQCYLATERVADAESGDWDWGGRVDLLLGTDSIFTTARGLDAYSFQRYGIENVASWAFTKDYGLALPQLYADVARGDVTLRFGHFYGIFGFEQVPAIGNFFYSHAFSMQYSPFTFTGMLGSWTPSDGLTVYAGIHTGWNNFTDPMPTAGRWAIVNPEAPGAGSTAGFLGGVVLANDDRSRTLAISTTSGNEVSSLGAAPADGSLVGNRSLITTVFTAILTDRLTYVFEHDAAWQFNAGVPPGNVGQPGGLAQWYSFNQYLFWRFNERWAGGVRLEYFRDNNGYLVTIPIRNLSEAGNPGFYSSGFAGNFWELTWGLNYRPNRYWVFRPELRYDWFTPNAGVTKRPYGSGVGQGINTAGDRLGQFYAGCDAIWRF